MSEEYEPGNALAPIDEGRGSTDRREPHCAGEDEAEVREHVESLADTDSIHR